MRWAGQKSKGAVVGAEDWGVGQCPVDNSFILLFKSLKPTAGNHDFSSGGWVAREAAGDKMCISFWMYWQEHYFILNYKEDAHLMTQIVKESWENRPLASEPVL